MTYFERVGESAPRNIASGGVPAIRQAMAYERWGCARANASDLLFTSIPVT